MEEAKLVGGSYYFSLPQDYFPNYGKHDIEGDKKVDPRWYKFSFKIEVVAHPG